jgi:hypothetical protein
MIRAPLMVVAYKRMSDTSPHAVGAYVADAEVDRPLKLSEPPAHDKWDPDSSNLRDASGENRNIVTAVLSRVKSALKRFQQEAAPPPPPKQRRLNFLERALASFFKPVAAGSGVPPDQSYSPIHIQFSSPPQSAATGDGKLRIRAAFSVHIDERSEEDLVNLRLRVASPILEDSDQEGDDVPVNVKCVGVSHKQHEEDSASLTFRIAKGDRASFEVESEPYDSNWTVRLRPEVERYVEAGK